MQDDCAVSGSLDQAATVQRVRLEPLPELEPAGHALLAGRLDLIGDLKLKLRAVVGEGEISVATLFALKDGSLLPLDCGINPLVAVELDGKTIARGELVEVDESLGVRLTEVGHVAG
jgi:flagellar motor switch protein FliN/FliY